MSPLGIVPLEAMFCLFFQWNLFFSESWKKNTSEKKNLKNNFSPWCSFPPGIVPLEAMFCRTPVVAVNSGGPLETVEHEKTGFLCEGTASSFAKAMEAFILVSKSTKFYIKKNNFFYSFYIGEEKDEKTSFYIGKSVEGIGKKVYTFYIEGIGKSVVLVHY